MRMQTQTAYSNRLDVFLSFQVMHASSYLARWLIATGMSHSGGKNRTFARQDVK